MEVNGRKVSVKFFLNQDVKGRTFSFNGEVLQYPLYVRVTYNRKTTRFAIPNNWFPLEKEVYLKDIEELQVLERVIGKIVAYEVGEFGENFTINGLGERLKTYFSKMLPGLEALLDKELKEVMESELTYSDYKIWNRNPLHEKIRIAVQKLGDRIPENLRVNIIHTAFFSNNNASGQIAIYQWLLPNDREQFTSGFLERIEKIMNGEENPFVAYGVVEVTEREDYESVIAKVEESCKLLLDLRYTEFFEIGGISINSK